MPRRRFQFVPCDSARLEERVVLSHSARGLSAVAAGLTPSQQILNQKQQPVIAEVNQAFASFASDYDQARATYFASIAGESTADPAATTAFSLYTKQRVSLLANQVISSFLQTPTGTARAAGQPEALRVLVSTKLINPQGNDPVGTLANSLLSTIPPAGTSASTASLYSLSQDNAIASARIAIDNGVTIVKEGDFGNQAKSGH